MKSAKVLALAMLFLLTSMVPLVTVEAATEQRKDTDRGYLSEKWRAGLGTGLGALNSIKSASILSAIFTPLSLLCTFIVGIVWMKEKLTVPQIIGGLLSIVATLILTLSK